MGVNGSMDSFGTVEPRVSADRGSSLGRLQQYRTSQHLHLPRSTCPYPATTTTTTTTTTSSSMHSAMASLLLNQDLWNVCKSLQQGVAMPDYKNGDLAAIAGHKDLIQQAEGMKMTPLAMIKAAESGDLPMLRLLHERGAPCTSTAMDKAAANGHLEAVKFLHENRTEGASVTAMNLAAGNGHVAVLQFLHENRCEGCTGLAYSFAAASGNIEILNWLKKNTKVAISPFAMDEAAAAGQLEALQWLLAQGCLSTPRAVDRAASAGHLAVVQWLTRNTNRGFTFEAVDESARKGHREILVHLIALGASPAPTTLILAAVNDHIDIAAWLVTLGVDLTVELDQLCSAAGKTRTLRYLHSLAEECRVGDKKPLNDEPAASPALAVAAM